MTVYTAMVIAVDVPVGVSPDLAAAVPVVPVLAATTGPAVTPFSVMSAKMEHVSQNAIRMHVKCIAMAVPALRCAVTVKNAVVTFLITVKPLVI